MNKINSMIQSVLNCFSDTSNVFSDFDTQMIEKRNPDLYTTIGVKSMEFENDFYASGIGRLVPITVIFRVSILANSNTLPNILYSHFENVIVSKFWSSGLNIVKTTTKPIEINKSYNKLELYSEFTVSGIAVM